MCTVYNFGQHDSTQKSMSNKKLMVSGISQIVIPARLYLEMIRSGTVLYFRWVKELSGKKVPRYIKEAEK